MKHARTQHGFTLIELVVVIVILGILAATALPKFVDMGKDARAAAMKAVEGSMRTTDAMIYAKAAVGNKLNGVTGTAVTVTINGQSIATVYGFSEDLGELVKLMDLSSSDFDSTTTANTIFHKGAADTANCKVVYTPATSTSAPPQFATTTTGC